jgi:hypothetical protein
VFALEMEEKFAIGNLDQEKRTQEANNKEVVHRYDCKEWVSKVRTLGGG